MPSHVHIGGIQFLIMGLTILIWLALFRIIEIHLHNNVIGKSLAFIH